MIKVIATYHHDHIVSLEMKGHAKSAPYGEDLVCAGASAVVLGGINAIEDDSNFIYEIKEGYAFIKAKEEPSHDDEIVLRTVLTQLKSLENDYAKFIKIEERTK